MPECQMIPRRCCCTSVRDLGNGLANLHNARRAHVPMLVVIGDHATYHKNYDAPLESDIDSVAGTVSGWLRRSVDVAEVATDAAEAVTQRGNIVTSRR